MVKACIIYCIICYIIAPIVFILIEAFFYIIQNHLPIRYVSSATKADFCCFCLLAPFYIAVAVVIMFLWIIHAIFGKLFDLLFVRTGMYKTKNRLYEKIDFKEIS